MPDAQFALPHHATPIPMYPPLRTPQGKQPRHHAAPCRVHRLVGSNDLPAAPRRPDLYHHHCMPGVWFRDVSLVGLRAASSLRCQPFLALPLPLRHPLHLPKTMRGSTPSLLRFRSMAMTHLYYVSVHRELTRYAIDFLADVRNLTCTPLFLLPISMTSSATDLLDSTTTQSLWPSSMPSSLRCLILQGWWAAPCSSYVALLCTRMVRGIATCHPCSTLLFSFRLSSLRILVLVRILAFFGLPSSNCNPCCPSL